MSDQPLAGVRVIELSDGIAGPYAGKLLADYGADVVKVEPPGGDRARALGPFPDSGPDPEQSAAFLHLNTNKRSVVGRPGDTLVDRLLAGADVVIQSSPDPDPAELRARHPRLVVASVTSFGLTGPLAGYAGEEIVHYAFGGPMSATGSAEREPVKMGGAIGQYQCGSVAAVSILAALAVAESSGDGVHIDLANVETQVCSIDRRMTYLLYGAYRGEDVERTGGYRVAALPGGCRPTLDGHVQISTLMNWIPRMLAVVENPDLAEIYQDPGFLFDEAAHEVADGLVLGWSLTRGKQDAMEEAQAGGWPVTAVNRPIDLLHDRHFSERGFFATVDHPVAGSIRQPGAPIRMDDGWSLRRPAPLLDEHRDEITAELDADQASESGGASETEPNPVPAAAATGARRLPLEGVRVLDMTVVWAGPYTTWMLADLGAEIIRVDNPWIFPSATRGVLPRPPADMVAEIGGIFGGYPDADPGDRPWNRVALFNAHARNKRSITLDLRKDAGRETLLRLAEQCDLMIENNSVDLLDKLGIGWDALHARNPALSLVRMPSVGLTGPYRDYLGFGVNFEGLCGLTSLRGYEGEDLSEGETVFHMDAASGAAGALAALMALRRSARTGVGELVELSQSENMMNHIGELFIDADRTGREHVPLGNRHHLHAPQGCYRSQGDDAFLVVSVVDDERWRALCDVMGRPELTDDARFSTAADRRANHDELDELVEAWTSSLTPTDAFHRCQAAGIAAAPVLHELESLVEPHFLERGMFAESGNDELGRHPYPTHLWHWDGPELAWGDLPVLGGDNEAVLRDVVGLGDDEIAALAADGHLSLDYLGPDGNPL